MKHIIFAGIIMISFSLATTVFGQEFISSDNSKSLREFIAQTSAETENSIPVVSPSVEVSVENEQSSKKTYINANMSIASSLESAKKLEDKFIYDNLVKLILYGTFEEKASFVSSKNYTFPKRFISMPISSKNQKIQNKLPIQVCHKENCHIENVCGWKHNCEVVAELTCLSATGLVFYYTVPITAVTTVISNLGATVACDYIAKELCEDMQDCQNVEKCDTVCTWQSSGDIQPGECVETPNGTVCH